jgi:hypothetical protein
MAGMSEPEQLLTAIEKAAIEAAVGAESSLKGMVRLPDSRGREVQMAYVDGYLLGCQDVLRHIQRHRAWANPTPQDIQTQSYFGGATKMYRRVRLTIEAMIVDAKQRLHMLKVQDSGERIVAEGKEILDRLKESDGGV